MRLSLPSDPDQRKATIILRGIVAVVALIPALLFGWIAENVIVAWIAYVGCIVLNEISIKNHYRELLEAHKVRGERQERLDVLMRKVRMNIRPSTPLEAFAMRDEIDFIAGHLVADNFDAPHEAQMAMRDELYAYQESVNRDFK